MNDLTNKLNSIIVCANEIKESIREHWYTLFMGDDGKENYTAFSEETYDIRCNLSNIRDIINEILKDK